MNLTGDTDRKAIDQCRAGIVEPVAEDLPRWAVGLQGQRAAKGQDGGLLGFPVQVGIDTVAAGGLMGRDRVRPESQSVQQGDNGGAIGQHRGLKAKLAGTPGVFVDAVGEVGGGE